MILLIDVGNSNIVFGLSENNEISNIFRVKSFTDKTSDEYYFILKTLLSDLSFDDVIISSVVPIITSALKKVFSNYYHIDAKILGQGFKTGVMPKVEDPKTVGADLICDAVGATLLSPESIVVDLGTATKYLYIKNNVLLGASIAPGVAVSMKAMVSNAALLPNVELVTPKKVLGSNTITCMQSGVIYGAASQVDGMIDRIFEEIDNYCPVYATGGLSSLIAPLCKHNIKLEPNLTLNGLLEIYHKNNK